MSIIFQGLNDYIKADISNNGSYHLNDIIIHTLAWNSFDFGLLTVTIGVSAKLSITIDPTSSIHYYNMTIQGQILKGLSDLSLSNIEEVPESLLQEETILSLFGLENITSDNIEIKAKELHSQLCSNIHIDKEHKYWFPIVDIKEKYGIKLWPADLPDNCFGRLYFLPSAATIYDPANIYKPYPDEPIPRGAILLNRRYYINEINPDDIITTAHELTH